MTTHRILGIGDNTVDTYVSSRTQYPGGNAVNVAVLARRLGAVTAYMGCLGDDEGGELVRGALRAEGVDISHARTRHGANARAFVSHDDGDRHFLGSHPGVRAQYQFTDADFDYIGEFHLAHTSVYSDLAPVLPRLAASVPLLSFDYSNRWNTALLANTLPNVGIAFLSGADLDDIGCERLLETCIGKGASRAIVTRGSRGAMGTDGQRIYPQPVLAAKVVDTLGAGDGFISAFLVAHLDGLPMPDCMRAGATFAAEVCGWRGGFGHGQPWDGDGGPPRSLQ